MAGEMGRMWWSCPQPSQLQTPMETQTQVLALPSPALLPLVRFWYNKNINRVFKSVHIVGDTSPVGLCSNLFL